MDNKTIRRNNLRIAIDQCFDGVDAKLAAAINAQPNQISRIFTSNENSKRNVGEKLARSIEKAINEPTGWMDQDHSGAPTDNTTQGPTNSYHMAAIANLDGQVTKRSQQALNKIISAAKDGSLTEEDILLLQGIAHRFEQTTKK